MSRRVVFILKALVKYHYINCQLSLILYSHISLYDHIFTVELPSLLHIATHLKDGQFVIIVSNREGRGRSKSMNSEITNQSE